MVIGINPAPVSVSVGHYYQGSLGQTLCRRLRAAGILILQNSPGECEDDQAVKAGVGFTDVVKRPTPRADEIGKNELLYGRAAPEEKLAAEPVPLVIYAFKKSATTLLGRFEGNGLLSGRPLAGSEVFVMPRPYESSTTVSPTLDWLKNYWRASR